MKATEVLDDLKRRFPNEPEYLQAVEDHNNRGCIQRASRI